VAMHAMSACRKIGVSPNKDIIFVSFANLPITSILENPPMASVEQFPYEMGFKAAELLLSLIENDNPQPYKDIVIPTELRIH
jgi:LacI family transcriptional regulator, repressor for deo operon, udp, cdd, tsx, nupC, and nupG